MYVCKYVCACMYVRTYTCMYAHMHAHVHVCTYAPTLGNCDKASKIGITSRVEVANRDSGLLVAKASSTMAMLYIAAGLPCKSCDAVASMSMLCLVARASVASGLPHNTRSISTLHSRPMLCMHKGMGQCGHVLVYAYVCTYVCTRTCM